MAGKFLHFLTFLNLILGSSKTQSRHIPSLYQLHSTLFGVHPSPSVAILVRLFDSAQNILCQHLSSQALMSGPPVSFLSLIYPMHLSPQIVTVDGQKFTLHQC